MTWTHTGTDQYASITSGQTSFTTAAGTIGNLRLYSSTVTAQTTATIASLSGGGVTTWARAGSVNTSNSDSVELWWGVITDSGTALTITYNTSPGSKLVDQRQVDFIPPTGGGTIAMQVAGTSSSASSTSIAFPTLTPAGAGDLYYGDTLLGPVGTSSGSPAGYTFIADASSNVYCYNVNVTSSAQSPIGTQSSGSYDTVGAIFTVTGGGGGGGPTPGVINYVGSNFSGANSTTSGTTAAVTITGASTLGNTLILTSTTKDTTGGSLVSSVTDSKGNTWHLDANPTTKGNVLCVLASTQQDGGALTTSDTVTITYSATRSSGVAVDIREFSGIILGSYLDSATFVGSNTGVSSANTGNVTPVQGGDLIVACAGQAASVVITGGTTGTVGTYVSQNTITTGVTSQVTAHQILSASNVVMQEYDVTFASATPESGVIGAYLAAPALRPRMNLNQTVSLSSTW